jgi:hypothetical protein
VPLWGIDPKGGMELTFGRRRFERLACEDTASMLALPENAVAVMRGAATRASRAVAGCANRIVECPGRAYQGRVHAHAAGRAERAAVPPSATPLRAC